MDGHKCIGPWIQDVKIGKKLRSNRVEIREKSWRNCREKSQRNEEEIDRVDAKILRDNERTNSKIDKLIALRIQDMKTEEKRFSSKL